MATFTANVQGLYSVPIPLTANLTNITLNGALDSQQVVLEFQQNATGGWTVASSTITGLQQPVATANVNSFQLFIYNAGLSEWQAFGGSGAAGVSSLNSLTGALSLTAGANITLTPSGSTIQIAASGGGGVSSINGLTGTPSVTAGSGVSVNVSGSSIQVSALTTPWLDIQNYGGKPRIFFNSQATTTLTSGSGGSPNIGIAGTNGFVNGDGIVIWEAGNASSQTSPASFPTAAALCVQGSQTIKYAVVGADTLGGLTAISTSTSVTNAPAVFGNLAVAISSISVTSNVCTVNFSSPINAVANQTIHIVSVGTITAVNGVWPIASAPTASQITFAVTTANGTGTVTAASTGRISNVAVITAITRSAVGVITITTAEPHNYVASPSSQNAAVVIVENVTPVDLCGEYVIATASGTTITCNSGQWVAESGSVTAGSSTATCYEYIYVQAPAYSTGNYAFYIYSDSYSPGSALKLIGKTMPGERGWKDYGPTLMQGFVAPAYVPTTAAGAASAQNQMFGSTIVSGGGTTSLTLANGVPNPSGGLIVMHDDAQAAIAAFAAATAQADNFGVLNLSPPQSIIEFPQYIFNYPLTVPANCQVLQSCYVQANETITLAGANNWMSPFGSNRTLSPQFSVGTYAAIAGNASPLMYSFGDEVMITGVCFAIGGLQSNTVNDHNGQYGLIIRSGKFNAKQCFFGCGPSSSAVPLIINNPSNGGSAWYGFEDIQLSGSSVFTNNHVAGQSSLLPALPLFWIHWSDGNSGTGPAGIQMYGNCSFSGRGILLDGLNYITNSTQNYFFGVTGEIEFQSPCTPFLMCWGAIFHGIEVDNVVLDSQTGPALANWTSVYLSNVTLKNIQTSGGISIVTGNLIQALDFAGGNITPTITNPSILGQNVSLQSRSIGGVITTTGSTSDTVALYGVTTISPAFYGAGNALAAADIAAGNVSISVAANSITLTHGSTSGMIFNVGAFGGY